MSSGDSLISIAKKFCGLPGGVLEDLKVPLVDAVMVALHSGAILPTDRENALKDSVDRTNKMVLKKLHEVSSLPIDISNALKFYMNCSHLGG